MQPQPLKLSDDELDAVFAACRPLQPAARDAFLQDLADALQCYPEVGPGILHPTIVTLQKRYFDPPDTRSDDMIRHGGYDFRG
jgi:hypothetical protein